MRRIFFVILILSFQLNALTQKEKIQKDLLKLGVKSEIISETKKIDAESMEYSGFILNEIPEILKNVEKVYAKDKRNFVLAQILTAVYVDPDFKKKNYKKAQKYFDSYMKYAPDSYEKKINETAFWKVIDNQEKYKLAKEELEKEYKGTIVAEIFQLLDFDKENFEYIPDLKKKIISEIDKKEIQEKFGIPEEEVYEIKLRLLFYEIYRYFAKEEYEKGINYYLAEYKIDGSENAKQYNEYLEKKIWYSVADKVGKLDSWDRAVMYKEKMKNTDLYKKIRNY